MSGAIGESVISTHTRPIYRGSQATSSPHRELYHSPHTLVDALLVSLLLAAPELPPPVKPELELVLLVSPSLAQPEEAAAPPKSRPFSASASHSVSPVALLDARLEDASGRWGSKALKRLAGLRSAITRDVPRMEARIRMSGGSERILWVVGAGDGEGICMGRSLLAADMEGFKRSVEAVEVLREHEMCAYDLPSF